MNISRKKIARELTDCTGFEALEPRILLDGTDLTVGDIFRDPANPQVGQVVTLVASVVNDSATTMDQSFYADFTADGVSLTGGAGFLVDCESEPLAAGQQQYITMDYVYTGSWPVIGVEIDVYDQVAELAENNNSRTENFSIPSPDLTVVSLDHSSDVLAEGENVTFTATIANVAEAGTVRDFTISWYVNRGEGWELFSSELVRKDFNSGTQLQRKISFAAEYDFTQVKLSVDTTGEIDEINEWNNDAIDHINVAHPDLVISDITWRVVDPMSGQDPTIPWDGQQVRFTATVTNISSGGTDDNFSLRFIVDMGTAGEIVLGDVRIKNDIPARQADALIAAYEIDMVSLGGWTASPGEHTITVIADCNDEIPERYEFNNGYSAVAAAEEPSVNVADVVAAEPISGLATIEIPISLDSPATYDVGLYYSCEDGTAAAGADYIASEGVVTIAAGQSETTLSLQIKADGLIEGAETFYVRIYGQQFADCPDAIVSVTIEDSGLVVNDDNFSGIEDTAVQISAEELLVNDILPGGSAYYVSSVTAIAGGTASLVGGTVYFIPDSNFNGTASFRYYLYDGQLSAAAGTAYIEIAAVADAPVASDDALMTYGDTSWPVNVLTANDSDADSDWLSVTSVWDAVNCTVELVNGRLEFAPNAGFVGVASFSYTVSDSGGLTSSASVSVEVVDYLDYLAASIAPVVVTAGGSYSFIDADGDRVEVKLTGPGRALVYFDRDSQIYQADAVAIELYDTTLASSLIVRTKGRGSETKISSVSFAGDGDGLLKKLDMPTTIVSGSGITASRIDFLRIGSLAGDADIDIAYSRSAGMKLDIKGSLGDGDGSVNEINIGGDVAWIKLADAASDAELQAGTFGQIISRGDFSASINATDSRSNGLSIGKFIMGGQCSGANISAAADISLLKAGSLANASIYAAQVDKLIVKGDIDSVDISSGDIRLLKAGRDLLDSSVTVYNGGENARMLVGGWIADSDILTSDGLKQLRASGLAGSDIVCGTSGYSAPDFDQPIDLLDTARITRLDITGRIRDSLGRSVSDSRIVGGSLGRVKLNRAELDGDQRLLIGSGDWNGASVLIKRVGDRHFSTIEQLLSPGSGETNILEIV